MKKKQNKLTAAGTLRQSAEELLKMQQLSGNSLSTESDALKLSHELAVHQIELELQNSELINAKEELELALEKYTELYDFAPTGYITLSKDGQINELNLTAAKMIGKERWHLKNAIFGFFISYDTKPTFNHFLNEVFNKSTKQSCEVTLLTTSSTPLFVYLVGFLSKNGQADISMVDITDRKKTEEKMKQILNDLTIANKELDQSIQFNADKDLFISILAHDLRNPFSVLIGYTELLLENIRKLRSTEIDSLVREINDSTHSTFSLLEDLLKWSRLRTGKFPFEPQKLNFTGICRDVIKVFQPNANSKNITINCSVMDEIDVVADINMLRAVIRNLVSNAIKFSDRNGLVTISARKTNTTILFSVSDNGTGIESETITRLFDISHFRSSPGTANEKGSGLGLLLCKEFVEKHGGRIWVESEYGKGSTFYFNIPRIYEAEVKEAGEETGDDYQVKNLKILIADDNAALRLILGSLVKGYSRKIIYAKTGAEAIQVYNNNPDTDLILMDFNMPEMNGYEAARRIRLLNKKIIIIVETAYNPSEIAVNSAAEGINGFFFKPYNRSFLNHLINKHFRGNQGVVRREA